MSADVVEIIKATLITEKNIKEIASFEMTKDIFGLPVILGNWFISLTLRVDAIFPSLGGEVTQFFYVVTKEVCFENLILTGEPSGILESFLAKRRYKH